MSVSSAGRLSDERLLTFEIGGSLYALPISGVLEVTELNEGLTCIPTLPTRVGGVINFHGDALPVIRSSSLLGIDGTDFENVGQLLVITDRSSHLARLGLPVDEVLGLVNGPAGNARGVNPVAERRSIDGRVANILDPGRLIARARTLIEQGLDETGETEGLRAEGSSARSDSR